VTHNPMIDGLRIRGVYTLGSHCRATIAVQSSTVLPV
jgi:hypothetical protein